MRFVIRLLVLAMYGALASGLVVQPIQTNSMMRLGCARNVRFSIHARSRANKTGLRGGSPTMSASADFALKVVAPLLGNAIGTMMFLSSMPAVLKARQAGALGSINPLPYPAIIGNCAAWLFYGAAVKNSWIIAPNISGLAIGLFYTLSVYPLAKIQDKRTILNTLAAYAVLFISVVGGLKANFIKASAQTAYGLMANFCLLFFYAAPLTTLSAVIKTKNAKSIDPLLSMCGILNGLFWGIYGFALKDLYVCLPNAIGCGLNIMTSTARAMYGARD